MYVHIGKNNVIETNKIVSILNLKTLLQDKTLEEVIKEVKLENNIIDISEKTKKSLIIIEQDEKLIGYISSISSTTLAKRIQKGII